MKIITWNINGIRAAKQPLKHMLDTLDADVICFQETKVTRDQLDEPSAVVEGYNSYFSFSKVRSGYSGVAIFVRDTATPHKAEEGLSAILTEHQQDGIGCYGDLSEFSDEELHALDNEGRTVITQHRMMDQEGQMQLLTVINVYCPRADPEKAERGIFKLRFYKLLRIRAEAILKSGSHVIVLGDVNCSHKPIDHCDPAADEEFALNPGRQFLTDFLWEDQTAEGDESEPVPGHKFVDTFRYLHPTQESAFTCWSTMTSARATNYGHRIDYILADVKLTKSALTECIVQSEIEGSDHCPVKATLRWEFVPAKKCPPLCTKYLPQFAGRQQKLSSFFSKSTKQSSAQPANSRNVDVKESLLAATTEGVGLTVADSNCSKSLDPLSSNPSSSQDSSLSGSTQEEHPGSSQFAADGVSGLKRSGSNSGMKNSGSLKKRKSEDKKTVSGKQGSLLAFFHKPTKMQQSTGPTNSTSVTQQNAVGAKTAGKNEISSKDGARPNPPAKSKSASSWKSLLKGPPPPVPCRGHGEPCVLRTVKKEGPNKGRQFFVCAKPEGLKSNPDARCEHFEWTDKKKT